MTLAEFVAYLTNDRLPTDELFERQFDAAYPFDKQAFVARAYSVFNGSQVEGFGKDIEKAEFSVEKDVMAFFIQKS